MPLAKIHVLESQYDEARLGRVSSAVQNGLIRVLGIPSEDFATRCRVYTGLALDSRGSPGGRRWSSLQCGALTSERASLRVPVVAS